MLLNRFFRLEMVKCTHNHDPRTLNAPFRAARHPGLQNNKTGSIHVWTPVPYFNALILLLIGYNLYLSCAENHSGQISKIHGPPVILF